MSKLSELKASPDVGLAEYPAEVCVSAKLAAELEAADKVLFEAEARVEQARDREASARDALDRAQDPDAPRAPRRAGQSANTSLQQEVADAEREVADAEAEAAQAAEACDDIRERMKAHTVRLMLRGKPSGDWRRWVSQHPVREEDDDAAGHARDLRHAGGFCNVDALVADLHLWVASYDDEAPSEEWWEFVAAKGSPAHLTQAAALVVRMHEQVVDLGKSRRDWRAGRRSATTLK